MDYAKWKKWEGILLRGGSVRSQGRLISRIEDLPPIDDTPSLPHPAGRPPRPEPGFPEVE